MITIPDNCPKNCKEILNYKNNSICNFCPIFLKNISILNDNYIIGWNNFFMGIENINNLKRKYLNI